MLRILNRKRYNTLFLTENLIKGISKKKKIVQKQKSAHTSSKILQQLADLSKTE